MKDQKLENKGRRNFLMSAGVGSVGAAAVVAKGLSTQAPQPTGADSAGKQSGGYAETRHIRNYYRTARV